MYRFLVWHVLVVCISCELFREESGYVVDYAPQYHNYKPRDYHFNYGVSDATTGDHKSQWETKTDGVVRGGYSLLEPDGTTRIVEYIADDDGFRAVVNKVGSGIHPQQVQHEVVPVVPLSHRSYDGQVNNYAPSARYYVDQNLGTVAPVNQIGTTGVVPESHSSVFIQQPPAQRQHYTDGVIQGQQLETVPLQHHNIGGDEVQGHAQERVQLNQGHAVQGQNFNIHDDFGQTLFQRHNTPNVEVVPYIQGHNQAVPYHSGNINYDFGPLALQGHDIVRPEVVPHSQGQNLHSIQATPQEHRVLANDFERLVLQGHNIAPPEAVPLSQGHNLGSTNQIHGNEVHNLGRVELQGHNNLVAPGAVPIFQGHNLGGTNQIYGNEVHNLGRIGLPEAVPLSQGHNLGSTSQIYGNEARNLERIGLQGHNAAAPEAVPLSQRHNLGSTSQIYVNEARNLGRIGLQGHNAAPPEAVPLSQGHNLGSTSQIYGNVDHDLGRAGDQGRNIVVPEAVPIFQGHNLGNINQFYANAGHDLREAQVQGHNIATPEVVSTFQGHNLDNRNPIHGNAGHGLRPIEVQGHNVAAPAANPVFQGHNLGTIQAVPGISSQNLNYFDNVGQGHLQEHNIERTGVVPEFQTAVPFQGRLAETGLRREEVVPISQGHNAGQNLVQFQVIRDDALAQRQVPAVPEVISSGPSYSTIVDFQRRGYENRLRKDVYHSSPSRRVPKVVQSPHSKEKNPKKDFLIYYPESE